MGCGTGTGTDSDSDSDSESESRALARNEDSRGTQEEERILKRTTCFALILTAGLLMTASVAGAASIDRAGMWVSPVFYDVGPIAGTRALINDGSFEQGPPPASAWTEVNDTWCERIGDFSGYWYVSAFDGTYDFWAGGYCMDDSTGINTAVTASVAQDVPVPAGNATLSFYYIAFRPDPDDDPVDGDRAYVAVNGVEVWTLPFVQASNTYPNWVGPITVDLCAYEGQTIALSFGGVSVGEVTGNARFDYIEFIPSGPSPAGSPTWGLLKALYR
jgi:hypothetical protein